MHSAVAATRYSECFYLLTNHALRATLYLCNCCFFTKCMNWQKGCHITTSLEVSVQGHGLAHVSVCMYHSPELTNKQNNSHGRSGGRPIRTSFENVGLVIRPNLHRNSEGLGEEELFWWFDSTEKKVSSNSSPIFGWKCDCTIGCIFCNLKERIIIVNLHICWFSVKNWF